MKGGAWGGFVINHEHPPGNGETQTLAENIEIFNNIAYGSSSQGARIYNSANSSKNITNNVLVYNNTFCNNRRGILFQAAQGTGNVIRNNILCHNKDFQIAVKGKAVNDTKLLVWDHNLCYPFRGDLNEKHCEIEKDPQLVDAKANDFRLVSSSPTIDAGSNLLAPDYDFERKLRRSTVDIGAYEIGGNRKKNFHTSKHTSYYSPTRMRFDVTLIILITTEFQS